MSECPNCGADMKHSPCCGRVDTLRARVEELERELADAKIGAENAKLISFNYEQVGDRGESNAVVRSPMMSVLAAWVKRDFEATGASNFFTQELRFNDPDGLGFLVTVQKIGAKSPAELYNDKCREIRTLTAERDEARKIAAECYNAARWELSDQKVKQYAPIIYTWSQALTRHAEKGGE